MCEAQHVLQVASHLPTSAFSIRLLLLFGNNKTELLLIGNDTGLFFSNRSLISACAPGSFIRFHFFSFNKSLFLF